MDSKTEAWGMAAIFKDQDGNQFCLSSEVRLNTRPDIIEQVDAKALALSMPWSCRTRRNGLKAPAKCIATVKLKSKSDLEAAGLKSLLKAANAAAIGRRARTGQKAKSRRCCRVPALLIGFLLVPTF